MRAAPPVSIDLRCPAAWVRLGSGLGALAAAAASAGIAAQLELGAPALGGLALALAAAAAGGFAAARWAPKADGRLRWDGAQWWWRDPAAADEQAGEVAVVIDTGSAMLLRFRPQAGAARARWLPLGGAQAGVALRAALYGRAPAAVPALPREPG